MCGRGVLGGETTVQRCYIVEESDEHKHIRP